ncbi:DUF4282 domain-containing protein [Actinoallomurus iriomotensis]|uniref:DUF4282 domain-containing protein n=1 Tax=Actinoallomurus iriomotensis TaxID=478107 RepID=A0A9W6RV93_9ACTN|nr:DUF4282 domain-containing protein [Actinoallomurus iriomotensis]GLY80530.1 hypothetical protein Airi01_087970 [Actinoallomurus iriomotensis]
MTGPSYHGPDAPYGPGQPAPPPYPSPTVPFPCPDTAEQRPAPPVEPGLFATLLDFSFDRLVTVRLARLLYMLAVLCISGTAFVFIMFGWSLAAGSFWPFLGWCMVIGVPVLWLGSVALARVVVEYLVVQAKTSQDVAVLRDDVKEIKARAA